MDWVVSGDTHFLLLISVREMDPGVMVKPLTHTLACEHPMREYTIERKERKKSTLFYLHPLMCSTIDNTCKGPSRRDEQRAVLKILPVIFAFMIPISFQNGKRTYKKWLASGETKTLSFLLTSP